MPPDHPLQAVVEGEKGLGDLFAPQIEEGGPVPANDYPTYARSTNRATTMPPTTAVSTSTSAASFGAKPSNDPLMPKLGTRPLPSGRTARNVGE